MMSTLTMLRGHILRMMAMSIVGDDALRSHHDSAFCLLMVLVADDYFDDDVATTTPRLSCARRHAAVARGDGAMRSAVMPAQHDSAPLQPMMPTRAARDDDIEALPPARRLRIRGSCSPLDDEYLLFDDDTIRGFSPSREDMRYRFARTRRAASRDSRRRTGAAFILFFAIAFHTMRMLMTRYALIAQLLLLPPGLARAQKTIYAGAGRR